LCEVNKLHRLTEGNSSLADYFALFWDLGLLLGYLATSGAKSDVIFLHGDPDFLYKGDEILRLSHFVCPASDLENWQTTVRRQRRRPKQKAVTL